MLLKNVLSSISGRIIVKDGTKIYRNYALDDNGDMDYERLGDKLPEEVLNGEIDRICGSTDPEANTTVEVILIEVGRD